MWNVPFPEARDLLLSRVQPLFPGESVPLTAAFGRVLAEDIVAQADVPPFDRSPYDGYAFRAIDTANADQAHPLTFPILEEIAAGATGTQPIAPGSAVKILTGAPLPSGADAVVKYEDTVFTDQTVTLFSPLRPGENVVRRGEDVSSGDLLVPKGTPIDAALLGSLASQGMTRLLVHPRPKVGILTTGSELLEAGSPLSGGKIVNSNRYTFQGVLAEAGCDPVFLGAPDDTVDAIAQAMEHGLSHCDALLVTGGVSVGDYDLTPAALDAAGASTLVRSLALKPGGACVYGEREGKLLFCLSGNPAAALTNYDAVVLPVIRKLSGLCHPELPPLRVVLKKDYPKKSPRTRLLRGRLDLSDGTARMELSEGQGNGVLHTMIGCDLLAVVPAGSGPLPAGTSLEAYRLPSTLI